MLYALNKDNKKILAEPSARAICSCCGGQVIAKCGQIKIWHWAHKSKAVDCNFEPETDWHLNWKSYAAPERTEVKISKNGVYKMADILLSNGMVVEVQHSPISVEEIHLREKHYGKMLWIFDCTDAFNNGRIEIISKGTTQSERKSRVNDWLWNFLIKTMCIDESCIIWKYAKMTIISSCNKPVYLDLGEYCFKIDFSKIYSNKGGGKRLHGFLEKKKVMIDYISDLGRMDYQQYEKYNYEM